MGKLVILSSLLAPFLVLIYLPLVSSFDPKLDTGDPETWSRFWEMVSSKVYKHYLFAGPPGSFWKQFKVILSGFPRELGIAVVLIPVGAIIWWGKRRREILALSYMAAANLTFAANYQVLDVSVFTLPTILSLFVIAGAGAEWLLRRLKNPYATVILFICLTVSTTLNFKNNNLRSQTLCADFARGVLTHAESKGIVLSTVDTVSFSLWYMQYVKNIRPDLLVVSKGRAVDWYQEQVQRLRSDLIIERYEGANLASRWPALLVERNVERVPIYLTTNLAGYFAPPEVAKFNTLFYEVPAGLLMQLVPKTAAPTPEQVIKQNQSLWKQLWPDVLKARSQRLNTDMAALLLHYASMRILFARYCLWHGKAEACLSAAGDVKELNTVPLINLVNRQYRHQGLRYHMSNMPQVESMLRKLGLSLKEGGLNLKQVRQKLSPTSSSVKGIDQLNQEGIRKAKQGNFVEALTIFDTILQQAPYHLGARFNRAKILVELDQTRKAITDYEEILERSPNHVFALIGLADLKKAEDVQEAFALYRQALRSARNSPFETLVREKIKKLENAVINDADNR
jgi:tetratricopeptide (TPR) repeat protein